MFKTCFDNLTFSYANGGITKVSSIGSKEYRVFPNWVLACPKDGPGKVEILNDSIKYYRQGQAVVVQPNVPHRFFMTTQTPVISLWSHVNFCLPGNMDVAQFLETPVIVKGAAGRRIGEINEQLAKLPQNEYSLHNQSRFFELGFSLLRIICELSEEKGTSELFSDQSQRIRDLLVYIDSHLEEELTRDGLAEQCGLSSARFHVVFQKCTGIAPMEFVKHQRMNKAKILLVRTNRTISQVARMIGYEDQYTFSRAFKNTVGVSPQPYRQRARNDALLE